MSLDISQEVLVSELMRHTAAIGARERLSGSEQEGFAFDYIASELESFGFVVSRHETEALIGYPGPSSIDVIAQRPVSIPAHGVSLGGITPEEGIIAHVIDTGESSTDCWRTRGIEGCILLADGIATPAKVRAAELAGAIGAIFISDDLVYEMCVSPVWGSPDENDIEKLAQLPTVSVTRQAGHQLRDLLSTDNLQIRLMTQPDTQWRKIPTLVAEIRVLSTDQFVLFSGHVDSWHLGAMDNASANATQLEIGRLLALNRSQLKRGIRLAFWSGHSHGRYAGSSWYADHYWQDLHDSCVCHVNVDSLGGVGATVLANVPSMAETSAFASSVIERITGQHRSYKRMSRSSDQSFWGHGIPSLFGTFSEQEPDPESITGRMHGGGGFGWWWHTTEDTLDKIDPGNLNRDARVYALALWELLTCDRLPIDCAASVLEIAQAVAKYNEVAQGAIDLERTASLANRLYTGLSAFSLCNREANCLVQDLTRLLIPVSYTVRGPYHQDPALGSHPVPGLSLVYELVKYKPNTDGFHRAMITLVRERNRVEAALYQALRVIDSYGVRSE